MTRPDPMIPCKPGAQDRVAMENRIRWIQALYMHDGRESPDHPMHGLYTGLHIKYANWVGNH